MIAIPVSVPPPEVVTETVRETVTEEVPVEVTKEVSVKVTRTAEKTVMMTPPAVTRTVTVTAPPPKPTPVGGDGEAYYKCKITQLTSSPSFDADPSWCSDRIAHWSMKTGGGDLYIVNIDGTNERRLTFSPEKEMDPACSPDGTKIVYQIEGNGIDLWLLDLKTGERRQLGIGHWPAWSPDGCKIAYSDGGDICTMDADGSNRQRLTSSPELEYAPCFSPDGTKMIYSKGRPGRGGPNPVRGDANLWMMNSDGGDQRLLFSSDGEQVCFQEGWRDNRVLFMDAGTAHPSIWILDLDSNEKEGVAVDPNAANGDPAWSPDGTKIAFMSSRSGNGTY